MHPQTIAQNSPLLVNLSTVSTCQQPPNWGIPNASSFFHYKAFLLLSLSLHLCQMQVLVANPLAWNKQPSLALIWMVFIYFYNQENGAACLKWFIELFSWQTYLQLREVVIYSRKSITILVTLRKSLLGSGNYRVAVGKGTSPGSRLPWFKSWLCHFLPGSFQANYLTNLSQFPHMLKHW